MLRLRARAQRLSSDAAPGSTAAAVLRDVAGLQAQLLSAAWLGVRARRDGIRVTDLNRALNQQRSIVRSWLMRGTLHVVPAEDVRWLLDLLGPVFAHAATARHAELGLDDDLKTRGIAAIRRILSDAGPLTRYELVDRLHRRRLVLDPKSQAPIHLIRLAALQGILCLGPDRAGGESTYVLLDDWVGPAPLPSREAALAELARRYFAAYGPATVEDLRAWSGIAITEARSAVALAKASLTEVTIQAQPGFVLRQRLGRLITARAPGVRLLPAFDTYLLGYRSRDLAVPRPLQGRLQRGGGWLHPAVVVDGRAVAAWTLKTSRGRSQVRVDSFGSLGPVIQRGIEAEVRDIGRFLDRSLTIEIVP